MSELVEEERLKIKWGYGDRPPILPVTKDIHFLFTQIAALRTRTEQAETALAEIADTLNQELRENSGDRFQVNGIGEDMRPAIRMLVDCVHHQAKIERDG